MLHKPRREELLPHENLCDHCTAKCCKYFALPIDTPTTAKDFDFIRWYLVHESASIFTEDDTWYLLVHTTCKNLMADNRCGIYETRPQICRDYHTDNCEYEDHWTYDRYFELADQLVEYQEGIKGFRRKDSIRSRKPEKLSVVN